MEPSIFDINAFTPFDWKLVAVLGISVLVGIYRGALREIVSVLILAVAGYLAYVYGKQAGQFVTFVDTDRLKQIAGSIIVFITLAILCMIIKLIIFRVAGNSGPGAYDRFMGALFGVFRGYLLLLAVLVGIELAPRGEDLIKEDWYKHSVLTNYFQKTADDLAHSFPQELKDLIEPKDTTSLTTY